MNNVYYNNCDCHICTNWREKFHKEAKKKRIHQRESIYLIAMIVTCLLIFASILKPKLETYFSDSFVSIDNLQKTTIIS